MSRPAAHSRDELAAALLTVFRARGYEGASVAELLAATGLTKGGLYHHFPGGKDDMAATALAFVLALFDRIAFAPLASPGPPTERLARLAEALDEYFVGGQSPCLPAWMALGAERDRFSEAISGYFRRWIAALAALLVEMGASPDAAAAQAAAVVAELHGALTLSRALDAPGPFAQALERLRRLSPSNA